MTMPLIEYPVGVPLSNFPITLLYAFATPSDLTMLTTFLTFSGCSKARLIIDFPLLETPLISVPAEMQLFTTFISKAPFETLGAGTVSPMTFPFFTIA